MSTKIRSRQAIISELMKLERQIQNNTDPETLSALRADYRKASEELSLYYNDETQPVK